VTALARNISVAAMVDEPKPVVRVENVSLSLPDRRNRQIDILRNFNLTIETGEFVSIVGPSGCGKSTLLNCVASLRGGYSGRIEVLGNVVGRSDPAVGYMFQTHALLPWRSVISNTELGLELQGVAKAERRARCQDALSKLGLSGFEDHYPSEISGGMRQRVSLARMLVTKPSLLLMDEPFGALDAQTKLLVQELFLASWEESRQTVLFVTHDLAEAIAMSDRIILMSARPGRIIREYDVGIPRPRNLAQVRTAPRFVKLWEALWSDLRGEALRTMQGHDA
jgi:NitT/TauT family transport system ATP-binding protein